MSFDGKQFDLKKPKVLKGSKKYILFYKSIFKMKFTLHDKLHSDLKTKSNLYYNQNQHKILSVELFCKKVSFNQNKQKHI